MGCSHCGFEGAEYDDGACPACGEFTWDCCCECGGELSDADATLCESCAAELDVDTDSDLTTYTCLACGVDYLDEEGTEWDWLCYDCR